MPPAPIDRATLDRLAALGVRKGGLTPEDLARALPIDAMDPLDIALVVADLEERGVPVELDDALLLGPPRDPGTEPAFALPERRSERPPAAVVTGTGLAAVETAPSQAGPHPTPGRIASAHKAVALGGALALAVLAGLIALAAHLG